MSITDALQLWQKRQEKPDFSSNREERIKWLILLTKNYRRRSSTVGDGNGHVGKGIGKAAEVPEAIRKGVEEAKKNIIEVPVLNGTIPHATVGEFSASHIIMKPAKSGTGVIAGGPVRAVCELAGITDIRTKSIGSNNPNNMVNATMEGLKGLKSIEEVARVRGKSVEEIR